MTMTDMMELGYAIQKRQLSHAKSTDVANVLVLLEEEKLTNFTKDCGMGNGNSTEYAVIAVSEWYG